MNPSRARLGNLGLVAASLLAGLLALEAGARLVARLDAPQGPPGQLALSRYHPILGWEKTPGARMRIRRPEYDVTVAINPHGLRGPDRGYARTPGVRRVLILGDSFGEGYYVPEEASARAVLERVLNASCPGGYEVINGSTAGYSTDQEYLFFRDEGHKYSPDLVVVFFFSNDLADDTTGAGTGGKGKPYFVLDGERLVLRNTPVPEGPGSPFQEGARSGPKPWHHSMALRLLSNRTADGSPGLHRLLARFGLVEPISDYPPREFWPFTTDHRRDVDDMWRRTRAILLALKRDIEAGGGRLAILYVPIRFEVNDAAWDLTRARNSKERRWDRGKVVEDLKAAAETLGIPLLDPREALHRAEASGGAYFPKDGHWNEAGNSVGGRELSSLVMSLVPCGVPPKGDPGS